MCIFQKKIAPIKNNLYNHNCLIHFIVDFLRINTDTTLLGKKFHTTLYDKSLCKHRDGKTRVK